MRKIGIEAGLINISFEDNVKRKENLTVPEFLIGTEAIYPSWETRKSYCSRLTLRKCVYTSSNSVGPVNGAGSRDQLNEDGPG